MIKMVIPPTRTYCIAHGTLLSVMCQPGWTGIWRRMDTCVCMAESLCCYPETIITLLIGYTLIQNWRRKWQPTPVLLPGKSHGRRNLVGCSPWDHWESDTTEWLQFHFSLSCIDEGNGNPLQYSCLENPRDRGAWWAAVYEVTQGQTWLKQLSISIIQNTLKKIFKINIAR